MNNKQKPPATYAQAVRNATATVIIQDTEERTSEEVERQVTGTLQEHLGMNRVTRIRNGVKTVCENAEEATKVKEALAEEHADSDNLKINTAHLKKKKIIIFHVPASVTPGTIKAKIETSLGIDPTKEREDLIQLLKLLQARQDRKHIPVTLLEPLADYLLKRRTVCLGLKECPVKKYVTIQRCCDFDHVAVNCQQRQVCPFCAEDHKYDECPKRKRECIMCGPRCSV